MTISQNGRAGKPMQHHLCEYIGVESLTWPVLYQSRLLLEVAAREF